MWVANSLDGTVSRIDPEGAGVRGIAVGGAPAGIATSPDAVWVSDGHLDRVSRIDASGNVGQQLRTGDALAGVAVAGDSLVVATSSAGPILRGGTLRVSAPDFDSIDPAIAYLPWAWQALSITNDGLATFNRVACSDGRGSSRMAIFICSVSRRQDVHVPDATGNPVLDGCRQQIAIYRHWSPFATLEAT